MTSHHNGPLECVDNAQEALDLLWKMEQAGVKPNEVTFTTLISGFTRAGNLKVGRNPHNCVRHVHMLHFEYEVGSLGV